MIQMCARLLTGILGGLWLSLEEAQCRDKSPFKDMYTMSVSYCYNTSSGKSCFITDRTGHSHQMPRPIDIPDGNVNRWCDFAVPGSSLVIINDIESQRTVEISMGRQVLANEIFIIIDAQSVSTSVSLEWSYFVDHPTGTDATAEPHDEDRKIKREINDNDNGFPDKTCWESKPRHTVAKCVGHVKPQYRYICENAGAADTQTQFETGRDRQCICSSHLCINKIDGVTVESDSTWRTCYCHPGRMPTIVCRKVNEKFDDSTAKFADTDERSETTSAATFIQVLLILLAFFVIAFIVVAIILIIRKRKFSGRSEESMRRTNQNEAVSSGYETTVRDNLYELSGEGVPIYTGLELTQEQAPSNNTVYSSVQPTGEAVDMGNRVVYAELDNVAVVVSPVYSQPFEAETSASNAEYEEPFKPDDKSTATAPIPNLYDNIAAVDQQNVYSLAEAIPSSDPSVINSQPNKPGK